VPIPIPNVASHVLDIIIEWCRARSEPEPLAEDLQENDARAQPLPAADVDFFSKHMDRRYDLILAANYLHIESLIDAGCRFDAMNLQGKTTQEMCTYLKIKSDFTPEEMAANAREDEALLNPDAAPLEASSSTAQTV
jgi:S-phase kinase-associated protein 1